MNKPAHYEHKVVAAASLVPYANNSRTHSDQQVQQVAASMKEWGFTNPVLIDEGNSVVAGHCRLEAAQLLGMKDVPCIVLAGLSNAQRKAYVIADNRLALNAGWDDELLRIELDSLNEFDFELSLLGFNDDELAALSADIDFDPASEGEQGQLGELEPKIITCPSCGNKWDMRQDE